MNVSCPSCGSAEAARLGALPDVQAFAGRDTPAPLPGGALYDCGACALKYRFPVLSRAQYDALYDNEATDAWAETVPRADWALIAGYLARHAAPGASVLDFGCYNGGLLERLGPGYARAGVEVSAKARQAARERTGAEVVASLEALGGRQFDFVVAVDVAEHFADPAALLASLLALTRPGGTLILSTGDAEARLWKMAGAHWWYCYYPEHIAFISEPWARRWLARSAAPATLASVRRFRYLRLDPLRFARQSLLTTAYLAAPALYGRATAVVRKALGRASRAAPPGAGVSKDHLLLAFLKT
jgi:SAM-dependent methyltransferase